MSHVPSNSAASSAPKRPLSLGVIFLTLYIDLIGFSIIFPLGPDLLEYYLGPVDQVFGMNAMVDRERIDPQGKLLAARIK